MVLEVKDQVAGILLRQEALVQETSLALELREVPQMSSCAKAPDKTKGSRVIGSRGCGEEGV